MLEILLIRHGQTDWNAERRIMGQHPIGLNAVGKTQVKRLTDFLSPLSIDQLYTSPLLRTLESSHILNAKRGLKLQEEAAIREIECGEWVGRTFKEIRESPDYVEFYKYPHLVIGKTGECLEQVQKRGVCFIESLRSKFSKGKIALVTHADWIKSVLLHYLKTPLNQIGQIRIDNASLSYLTFEGENERVISINHSLDIEKLFVSRDSL